MTHPMARDEFEHLAAGDRLETTIGQFKLRAARIIEEEQAKASPDNALISFACDAIRFAREYGTFYHTILDSAADRMDRKRCAHGIRWPHECRECQEDVPPASEICQHYVKRATCILCSSKTTGLEKT